MHVLICSYEFDIGAEGICTGRLARALLDAGCEVTLITSSLARVGLAHEAFRYHIMPSAPLRPAKLFFHLAPFLGHIPTRFCYVWSRRVARLRLDTRPDLIYGRASPFQSVAAAHGLAARRRLPLWTHLSDPMPSPWWEKTHPDFGITLRAVHRLVAESQAVTFTTHEAIRFQEALLGHQLTAKAFVLNHVAPEPTLLPRRQNRAGTIFAYFGLFYGKRNALALLDGFRRHLSSHPHDRLLFVGTQRESVVPFAEHLGIAAAVRLAGRVDDVRRVMADVDVLVATDAFSPPHVFLSTKLVEYLVVNRPVLLISPEGSPGAWLLSRFPETIAVVCREEADAVSAGLDRSAACAAPDSAYRQRFALMQPFMARAVAARFLEEAAGRRR